MTVLALELAGFVWAVGQVSAGVAVRSAASKEATPGGEKESPGPLVKTKTKAPAKIAPPKRSTSSTVKTPTSATQPPMKPLIDNDATSPFPISYSVESQSTRGRGGRRYSLPTFLMNTLAPLAGGAVPGVEYELAVQAGCGGSSGIAFMRRLGVVADRESAETVRDYLYTEGLKTEIRQDGAEFTLWIEDEDRLLAAREMLAAFQSNPTDPRYASSRQTAEILREQRVNEALAAQKRQVRMTERWQGLQQHVPITIMLIVMSVWVGMIGQLGMERERYEPLYFAGIEFDPDSGRQVYNSMSDTLANGQFYRWLTPILIHFGPMHLVFNLLTLWSFGRAIEQRSGSWRFLRMVLVIALTSNIAQYLMSGPRFGGMSGVDFGLFGFLWMKSRYSPSYGVFMGSDFVIRFLFFAGLCVTGLLGPVANTAHFTGLAAGVLLALIPIAPRLWRHYQRQRSAR